MKITLKKARVLLKQAMETQGPDFVYDSSGGNECVYYPLLESGDNRSITGCLIGTVFKVAGVPDEYIRDLTGSVECDIEDTDTLSITNKAREYLGRAQACQDVGKTWGYSYEAVEESLA